MLNQIFAKGIRITNEVTQSTCCICPCLFLLVSEQFYEQNNTRSQVLIKDIVVETSIAHSKASKLTGISVWISTTLDSGSNQAKLQ